MNQLRKVNKLLIAGLLSLSLATGVLAGTVVKLNARLTKIEEVSAEQSKGISELYYVVANIVKVLTR